MISKWLSIIFKCQHRALHVCCQRENKCVCTWEGEPRVTISTSSNTASQRSNTLFNSKVSWLNVNRFVVHSGFLVKDESGPWWSIGQRGGRGVGWGGGGWEKSIFVRFLLYMGTVLLIMAHFSLHLISLPPRFPPTRSCHEGIYWHRLTIIHIHVNHLKKSHHFLQPESDV